MDQLIEKYLGKIQEANSIKTFKIPLRVIFDATISNFFQEIKDKYGKPLTKKEGALLLNKLKKEIERHTEGYKGM